MAVTITDTGKRITIAETNDKDNVPFSPGTLIIEDSGSMYYDPATAEATDGSARISVGGESYFSNSTPTITDLGGISAGTTFDKVPVTQVLNDLLYPYVAPSVSSTGMVYTPTGVVEQGSDVTYTAVKFTVNKGSKNIESVRLYCSNDDTDWYMDTTSLSTLNTQGSISVNVPITSYTLAGQRSYAYNVIVKELEGVQHHSQITGGPTFAYAYYHGVVDASVTADTITAAQVSALTKDVVSRSNRTYSYTATGQKLVFAYTTEVSKITDPNNFDITSGFEVVEVVGVPIPNNRTASYYVYIFKEPTVVTDFAVTFHR